MMNTKTSTWHSHAENAAGAATRTADGLVQHRDRRALAERELHAASAEVASLSGGSSPSRLERALERLEAAREAQALAA